MPAIRAASPLLLCLLLAGSALAAPPAGHRAAGPLRASIIDNGKRIDVNNVSMVVTNTGSFAYDKLTGNAGLEFPKGSGMTAVFAAGLWMGAKVGGQTRVALSEYSDEYGAGSAVGGVPDDPNKPEHHVYKLNRVYATTAVRDSALASYDAGAVPHGAPAVTVLGDGSLDILGDQMLWAVYNDLDAAKHNNQAGSTQPLGIEVQQTTYAFADAGPLANTIFVRFKVLNRGNNTLDSTFAGLWNDPDLGGFTDDLVGCDSSRSLGFVYNATDNDALYGITTPSVGFDLLRGPVDLVSGDTLGVHAFIKYIGGTDPQSATQTYNHLLGRNANGNPVINPVTGLPTNFQVSGDPLDGTGWLDTLPADRRFMLSSGPFSMAPGESLEIHAAIIVGQGPNRLSSVGKLECFADYVQAVFDQGLTRPFPAPDTTGCRQVLNCPRPASYWAAECTSNTQLTPQQLDLIAVRVDSLSTFFHWGPGTQQAQFCAIASTNDATNPRERAKREYAAFMASVASGDLHIAPTGGQPIRLLRTTPISCSGLRAVDLGELAATADTTKHLVDGEYVDQGAHPTALTGPGSGLLPYFNGGVGYAADLYGSSLDPGNGSLFHTVEIRFTADSSSGQYAYRYLRCSCSPRTILIQDYRKVPWTVWNVDDPQNPVQLNAGWMENELTADGRWDPVPAAVDGLGNRELIWPMASAYSGSVPDPYYFDPSRDDALAEGFEIDFQYVLWPVAVDDGGGGALPIDAGDKLVFQRGILPTPGVDSLMMGLEGQPLSDPAVAQQYDDVIQCLSGITHGQGIGTICDDPTPALVSLVSADVTPERAILRWSVGDYDGPVAVDRRAPGLDWTVARWSAPDGSGMVAYEDADVMAGERYGYRLRLGAGGPGLGEVWLTIPSVASLALGGLLPNPAGAELTVSLTLASREPGTLELIDVTGRRVLSRAVGSLGPGAHLVSLGDGRRLAAGVYLLRLTQGPLSVTRKAVVVR